MNKRIALLLPFLFLLGCSSAQVRRTAPPVDDGAKEELAAVAPQPSLPAPEPTAPPPRELPRVEPSPAPALSGRVTREPSPREFAAPAGEEKYVSLNFDNADIGVVVQTIAELIDLNYIVAPGVRGRVTIQSTSKIPVSSLFTVLEEILDVNSLTLVKSGNFYKVVPTNQARQKEIETVIEGQPTGPAGQQVIIKVVPLHYIRPTEVVKILNPLKSPAGIYLAHDPTKLLFLTDSAKKIAEMMKIVEILDVDTFARIQVELYPAKYIGVEDLARDLTQIVSAVYASTGRGKTVFKILPVAQINSLLIISGEPGLAQNIISWVIKMDQPATGVKEQIFVYPLAHAIAEDIAAVLTRVFTEKTGTTERTTAQTAGRTARAAPRTPAAAARQAARSPATGVVERTVTSGESPVTIVADKATNSLVILTSPWYYPVVEETIRKLDVLPKQVLIEVLIAELTLDDQTQFGLQWAIKGQGSAKIGGETHNFNSQVQNVFPPGESTGLALPGTGFSWLLSEANRITAVLNAYANDSKLNVLSSPHIVVADNKEATLNVGDEVPIITTQTTEAAGSVGLTNTVTNSVEYVSTGVLLTVTPHINEGRYVTLDIRQEVSIAEVNTLGGTQSPTINKRVAETTMVVKDNQTLVIGGLIDEQRTHSREGLPYLSRIPFFGYLFGVTLDRVEKKELVLLITPRVMANPEEGNAVSKMIRDRVLTLKEGIELFTDLPREEKQDAK
jgi:general secretion pathway protein D